MGGFEELDWSETPAGIISLRRRIRPALNVDVYEVKLGDEFLMSSLAPRTCYAWKARPPSKRTLWDMTVTEILVGIADRDAHQMSRRGCTPGTSGAAR